MSVLDLVFLDCETLGLDPAAPIWEFAAIRRTYPHSPASWEEYTCHFTICHDPEGWLEELPEQFAEDYRARYYRHTAWCERAAAYQIAEFTRGAYVVGCNPGFDLERLTRLLDRHLLEPGWHYHPMDIASVNMGYLAAANRLPPPPWKSDALSAAVGVDSASFARHTAMGDVRWVLAQWDAVTHPGRVELPGQDHIDAIALHAIAQRLEHKQG